MLCLLLRNSHISKTSVQRLGKNAYSLQHANYLFTSTMCLNDPKKIQRGKTPIGKLDQTTTQPTNDQDVVDAYAPFPDGQNPTTGEIGGPRGPEPTRYGDWERKGRVSDF